MTNPYTDTSLGEFFVVFFQRMVLFFKGDLGFADLASDEVQIIVLSLIAMSCALVGTFLVLKKMTMLANSLSHTILIGIVGAYLVLVHFYSPEQFLEGIPITGLLIASLITGLITTLVTQMLTSVMKLSEDASIGLVFTTFFALGIVAVTLFTRNVHLGIEAVTGNADALHPDDIKSAIGIFLFNLGLVCAFFKGFTIITFDSALARSYGFPVKTLEYLLMVQTAATAIGAFRAVGVLLFLSMLVAPVLAARLLTHHLKKILFGSAAIGLLGSILSVALSRHFFTVYETALSTSGILVCVVLLFYLIAIGLSRSFSLKPSKAEIQQAKIQPFDI